MAIIRNTIRSLYPQLIESTVNSKNIDWVSATFLIGYQLLFLICLPLYLVFCAQSWELWITMVILIALCGLSITAFYHRFYSHKTYLVSKVVETMAIFFGTLTMQGSVLEWSHDHRLHHKHVDTDKDPYCIKKGFWYAHFTWMLLRDDNFDHQIVQDLKKNPLVMFQHRYYAILLTLANLAVMLFFGWLFNDFVGAFVLLVLTRMFINHHVTWFINSLAHTWGVQPYSREHTAVNNWIVAILTLGEGYHNFHHTFAGDYRNGVRWYQIDPTKLVIWTLSKVGLARGLRKVDRTVIARKLLTADRKLMLDRVSQICHQEGEMMVAEINRKADNLVQKLARFSNLNRDYKALKKQRSKPEVRRLRFRIRRMRETIRIELRAWSRYCDEILQLQPTLA